MTQLNSFSTFCSQWKYKGVIHKKPYYKGLGFKWRSSNLLLGSTDWFIHSFTTSSTMSGTVLDAVESPSSLATKICTWLLSDVLIILELVSPSQSPSWVNDDYLNKANWQKYIFWYTANNPCCINYSHSFALKKPLHMWSISADSPSAFPTLQKARKWSKLSLQSSDIVLCVGCVLFIFQLVENCLTMLWFLAYDSVNQS